MAILKQYELGRGTIFGTIKNVDEILDTFLGMKPIKPLIQFLDENAPPLVISQVLKLPTPAEIMDEVLADLHNRREALIQRARR